MAGLFNSNFGLLLLYFVYILFGALVMSVVERPYEEQRCDKAKNNVEQKTDSFGMEYFFELGLNLNFCNGIDAYFNDYEGTFGYILCIEETVK